MSFMNKRFNVETTREIRLEELMKLIPDDEFVVIFDDLAGGERVPGGGRPV